MIPSACIRQSITLVLIHPSRFPTPLPRCLQEPFLSVCLKGAPCPILSNTVPRSSGVLRIDGCLARKRSQPTMAGICVDEGRGVRHVYRRGQHHRCRSTDPRSEGKTNGSRERLIEQQAKRRQGKMAGLEHRKYLAGPYLPDLRPRADTLPGKITVKASLKRGILRG